MWNHACCYGCWNALNEFRGVERKPTRIEGDEPKACCYCGTTSPSGIYVRMNARLVACRGHHAWEPDPPEVRP